MDKIPLLDLKKSLKRVNCASIQWSVMKMLKYSRFLLIILRLVYLITQGLLNNLWKTILLDLTYSINTLKIVYNGRVLAIIIMNRTLKWSKSKISTPWLIWNWQKEQKWWNSLK